MKMKPVRHLVLRVNTQKQGAKDLARILLKKAECTGVVGVEIYDQSIGPGYLKQADACCTIGGDGTLLSVVEEAIREQTPVLGINCGKLGFMTAFSAAEAEEKFSMFLQGQCQITERRVLECNSPGTKYAAWALNDVVVKVDASRLTHFTVFAGTECVNRYACDGLIFCTPTGSTAYNLSAGGALIDPNAEVMAMTPICPHTLSNRTVIFHQNTVLKVSLDEDNRHVRISHDGQICCNALEAFPLTLTVSPKSFKLVHLPGYSYYQMVRAKLGWG